MAEGWAHHLFGSGSNAYRFYSAGTQKQGLNPLAARVMAEAGIDISGQHSKLVADLPQKNFDFVFTVCAHADAHCPISPGGARKVHVGFDDPPRLAQYAASEEEALSHYRRVRDEIGAFVRSIEKYFDG